NRGARAESAARPRSRKGETLGRPCCSSRGAVSRHCESQKACAQRQALLRQQCPQKGITMSDETQHDNNARRRFLKRAATVSGALPFSQGLTGGAAAVALIAPATAPTTR